MSKKQAISLITKLKSNSTRASRLSACGGYSWKLTASNLDGEALEYIANRRDLELVDNFCEFVVWCKI